MWESLRPFLLSAVIGLLIGIEREKSHPPGEQPFGVRTLVILSLLGTVAAVIPVKAIAVVLAAFVAAAILLGYARSTRRARSTDLGFTTEMTALFVFCAGFLAPSAPQVISVLSVFVLAILLSRRWIHRFTRQTIKPSELQALVTLLVLAVGIVPLLPATSWNVGQIQFAPRQFGFIVSAIATLQFGSYVLLRALGPRLGLSLAGFLGGWVSSTAVFLTLPAHARTHAQAFRPVLAGLVLAVAASLLELVFLVAVTAPELLRKTALPVGIMVGASALAALVFTGVGAKGAGASRPDTLPSPLWLQSVLKLALVVALLMILTQAAQLGFGPSATRAVAFFAGLFELHATTFAVSQMVSSGAASAEIGLASLGLAVGASFASKIALLWIQKDRRLAVAGTSTLLALLGVGAVFAAL